MVVVKAHFGLSKSKYYQRDNDIQFVPWKNIRGEYNNKGSFSSTSQTNSMCLRDKEYKLERILILFSVHPRTKKQIEDFKLRDKLTWLNEGFQPLNSDNRGCFYGLLCWGI